MLGWYGSLGTGTLTASAADFTYDSTGTRMGQRAPVADVTGDGLPELLLGDPTSSEAEYRAGAAFLVSPAGL